MCKDVIYVTRGMKYTDNVNTVPDGKVEDEVLLEASHRKPAKAIKPYDAGIIQDTAQRVIAQSGACFVHCVEIAFRQRDTGLFSKVNELFQQIQPGARPLSDDRHYRDWDLPRSAHCPESASARDRFLGRTR